MAVQVRPHSSQVLRSIILADLATANVWVRDYKEFNTHTSSEFLLIIHGRNRRMLNGNESWEETTDFHRLFCCLEFELLPTNSRLFFVYRWDKFQHPTTSPQIQTQRFCRWLCRPSVVALVRWRPSRLVLAPFSFFLARSATPTRFSSSTRVWSIPPRQRLDRRFFLK